MPDLLYLDTARVGQISPSAHYALTDYIRLHAEQRWPLYFDEFFRESVSLPDSILSEYRGLECWKGIGHLKDELRRLMAADANSDIWFSSRSVKLMDLAAKLMFRRCRSVLISDLTWPNYESVLRKAVPNLSCTITKVKIAERIRAGCTPSELVSFIAECFVNSRCDGLFLPLVSNLGVRLPFKQTVHEIRERAQLRFACVDIAQAVNHLPIETDSCCFDFAIGGTHKWLRSYLPLSFALSGNPRTRDFIADSANRWIEKSMIDDPLFEFANPDRAHDGNGFGETINASPFLTCAGAVMDAKEESNKYHDCDDRRTAREAIVAIFGKSGLRLQDTHPGFWSNIVAFTNSSKPTATATVHRRLRTLGIASSIVDNVLRISIPSFGLSPSQIEQLEGINHV